MHTNLLLKKNIKFFVLTKIYNFFAYILLYINVYMRFYQTICFSKLVMDWFPLINPYIWPFSFFKIVADPYFNFWSEIVPAVYFNGFAVFLSKICAMQFFSTFEFLLKLLIQSILEILKEQL